MPRRKKQQEDDLPEALSGEGREVAIRIFDLVEGEGIPREIQSMMALRSFGFSTEEIAEVLDSTPKSIRNALNAYDQTSICEKGDALRKLTLACFFEQTAYMALQGIRTEDFSMMSVKDRVRVAKECMSAVQKMNVKRIIVDKSEFDLLKTLEIEAEKVAREYTDEEYDLLLEEEQVVEPEEGCDEADEEG